MSYLTIKLEVKEQGLETLVEVVDAINQIHMGILSHVLPICESIDLKQIKEALEQEYPTLVDFREGVTNGCYGSSTGVTTKGLTMYSHLKNFADRWVDDNGDEIVNPWHLMADNALSYIEISDDTYDALIQSYEQLGHEIKADNTYNYAGQCDEDGYFLTDFNFECIESDKGACILLRFHQGGDPRGNYGPYYLVILNYFEDMYNIIIPRKELTEEN